MKAKDLRNKTIEQLKSDVEKMEKEVIDTYWAVRTGKEDDVRKPRRMRKELATMKTILNEKDNLSTSQDNGKQDENDGSSNK